MNYLWSLQAFVAGADEGQSRKFCVDQKILHIAHVLIERLLARCAQGAGELQVFFASSDHGRIGACTSLLHGISYYKGAWHVVIYVSSKRLIAAWVPSLL